MEEIVFIRQDVDEITKALLKNGYQVQRAFPATGRITNFIRRKCFQYQLGHPEKWYNNETASMNAKTIVVYDAIVTEKYIWWLREKNPEARIVLIFLNIVKTALNPLKFPDDIELWTMDRQDSIEYGMHYFCGGYPVTERNRSAKEKKRDIYFLGLNKGRGTRLKELEEQFKQLGVSAFFYVVSDNKLLRQFYKPFIPYEQVLKEVSESKVVLELLQEGQTGVTFRTWEAMFGGVKLMTNNADIVHYPFYRKENIFVIGQDSWETLQEFVKTPFVNVENQLLEEYTLDHLVESILVEK